ncbi:MAG: magnesium-translocating P-type ATPase [Patescibacteria group bacterium]|nr:magnesium-translocating P-type ATPase [Patescibacteria group bacterium]
MADDKVQIAKEKPIIWALPIKEVLSFLNTSTSGLTTKDVQARILSYGKNAIEEREKIRVWEIFARQFKSTLVLILAVAAVVSFFLGEHLSAAVILLMVFLGAGLSFFQEYRAEKVLQALKKYLTLKVRVLRNGQVAEIDSKELVPGDIVYLDIGDVIPADIRLIELKDMTTDESVLTGESLPVLKEVTVVSKQYSVPQYLHNMAFMGTSVSSGSGNGVVVATGKNTFFGETSKYLQEKNETDFQKNIKKFSNFLLKVILSMAVFIFLGNVLLGKSIIDFLLFSLALAVGITPELLPLVITIALSSGAVRMSKKMVIIKRLISVEDLGNIDTLCCDKTGTLTEGKISLIDYIDWNGQRDSKILLYGLICNSADIKAKHKVFTNPLDKAIWDNEGVKQLELVLGKMVCLDKIEFDFERKRQSSVTKDGDRLDLLVKGAPESVLSVSTNIEISGEKRSLDAKLKAEFNERVVNYEKSGYRVIAVAKKQIKKEAAEVVDEKDLTLVGFLLFLDPAKQTAKEALRKFNELGVDIKIITGDSAVVTQKICSEVGLSIVENKIILGEDLDKLNPQQFEEYSHRYNIFARTTPEQKFKIVTSLNKEGRIVGFLGDGVNDAPALKAADVGISVDTGTSIAKEAADIILLRKSLRVLAEGITEGRKTFGNITKYILNTVSSNYGNMMTVALSSFWFSFVPLLPSQILLNNFLSDMSMLTISTDNVDDEFVRKPKRWNIKLISRFMLYFGPISTIFDLITIGFLIFIFRASIDLFRTAWFVESTFSQIIVIFFLRSKLPFYKSRPSKSLFIAVFLVVAFALFITYTSFGRSFFGFTNMPISVLIMIFFVLIFYYAAAEIAKRILYKKFDI